MKQRPVSTILLCVFLLSPAAGASQTPRCAAGKADCGTGGSGGSVQRLPSRHFYFRNNCREELRLALSYVGPYGDHEVRGWWTFEPGEGAYLSTGGDRIQVSDSQIQYYAESESFEWRSDTFVRIELRGRDLPMRWQKVSTDGDGDYVLTLTCD